MNIKRISNRELEFSSDISPDNVSKNDDELTEFRGVAYGGGVLKSIPSVPNIVIDLNAVNFKAKVPILFNHDRSKIVGYGELKVKDGQLLSRGVISKSTAAGIEVEGLLAEGFPMQQSVGIRPNKIKPKSGKFSMNGNDFSGDHHIFTNPEVFEVSLCPLGADSTTSTELFTDVRIDGEEKMNLAKASKHLDADQLAEFNQTLTDSGLEAALDFAFDCGCSGGKAGSVDEMNEEGKATIDNLMAEIEKLRGKLKVQEEAAEFAARLTTINEFEKKIGHKFDDDKLEMLQKMDSVHLKQTLEVVELSKPATKAKNQGLKIVDETPNTSELTGKVTDDTESNVVAFNQKVVALQESENISFEEALNRVRAESAGA